MWKRVDGLRTPEFGTPRPFRDELNHPVREGYEDRSRRPGLRVVPTAGPVPNLRGGHEKRPALLAGRASTEVSA